MDSCDLYRMLSDARPDEAIADGLGLENIAALLRYSRQNSDLREHVLNQGREANSCKTQGRIELYAISYVSDLCVNDCAYCGLGSDRGSSRTILDENGLRREIQAAARLMTKELCILAGEHHLVTPEYLALSASIAQDTGIGLLTFNVAPMDAEGFQTIRNATTLPLQYRLFQETYDPVMYRAYHTRGPKRDFARRRAAQDRALDAGFDDVGLGALLGLNTTHTPYRGIGHDFEILSLVNHAKEIAASFGKTPRSLSLPRIQPVEGAVLSNITPVSDEDYIFYHALLCIALPQPKLIATRRERPGLLDELRPFIGIEDLAPRPGVGGNIRETRFQNELSDPRSAEEIIEDLKRKGYVPMLRGEV